MPPNSLPIPVLDHVIINVRDGLDAAAGRDAGRGRPPGGQPGAPPWTRW